MPRWRRGVENIGPSPTIPSHPTFANTIEALELADETLDRVAGVFYNLAGSDSNPEREALQRDFAPKLSAYSSEITNNARPWERIDELWERRESLGLTTSRCACST
jgi:peptidyl-dipeptidase Dcp